MKLRNRVVLIGASIGLALMFFNPPNLFSGVYWAPEPDPDAVTLRAIRNFKGSFDVSYTVGSEQYSVPDASPSPWVLHLLVPETQEVSMRVGASGWHPDRGQKVSCEIFRKSNKPIENTRDDGGSARCHEGRPIDFGDLIKPGK